MRKKKAERVGIDLIFQDDQEREGLVNQIIQTDDQNLSAERLAFLLIELWDVLKRSKGERWELVVMEMEGLLEATFRQSLAYVYALELYKSRLDIKGMVEPNDLLRELMKTSLTNDARRKRGER